MELLVLPKLLISVLKIKAISRASIGSSAFFKSNVESRHYWKYMPLSVILVKRSILFLQ